jgi:hypothetical protein
MTSSGVRLFLGAVLIAVVLGGCHWAPSRAASPSAPAGSAPAGTIDPGIGVSTQPVTPVVPFDQGTFEGFATYSYIPEHPTGIVYLFHGTGGSADFATKIETVDLLNELIARGFGLVATESTQRTGAKRWNVDDPSRTSNPDLARMERLRQQVINTTAVESATPTYAIGMSNGSAFAALWTAALTEAGIPISAVGLYMAGPRQAVEQLGGLRVPTFMVIAENDTRTSSTKMRADLAKIAAAGVPTELHEVVERPVTADRYLRTPGVTRETADGIVTALQQAGIIDASGNLLIELRNLEGSRDQLGATIRLPAGLTEEQKAAVNDETLAMFGAHQFNAEFKEQNAAFFESHAGR